MKTLHRPWPAGGLRRRYSTKEYFQRNLKSVDALCAHNSGEANHKVLPVNAKQDTVKAAAVLLGLGLTHPVELLQLKPLASQNPALQSAPTHPQDVTPPELQSLERLATGDALEPTSALRRLPNGVPIFSSGNPAALPNT
ncbi:hypothetical protein PtA15_2A370 [Puccinia triticina]|uniref:Uncharacterized protein n=1 Tax=Puccinia triticina TaxID=208348 RepID=A0ABY7CC88_9BASI|nr:uncharacterized protein PtA15_2A370 [Puccinia triticina]WAQ82057.1 hypothetical protein PtA15_2A370 [Puccinia triticina]